MQLRTRLYHLAQLGEPAVPSPAEGKLCGASITLALGFHPWAQHLTGHMFICVFW